VTRLGSRYYVDARDLERLVEQRGRATVAA
jgi:hypothetical protein